MACRLLIGKDGNPPAGYLPVLCVHCRAEMPVEVPAGLTSLHTLEGQVRCRCCDKTFYYRVTLTTEVRPL